MHRVIPCHSSCLRTTDYLPLLAAPGRGRAYRQLSLESVWAGRLTGRRLLPMPTGRHALWAFLALCRGRLAPGDEVVLAGFNFYVVAAVLRQWGLVPVFADIEPETLCLDPQRIAPLVTERTRLVVVTHMFGHPADLPAIRAVCRRFGLLLFEDCAHAVGTRTADGAQVGADSDGALFSFGIQKIVNTFGGGMLAVPEDLAAAGPLPGHHPSPVEAFVSLGSRAAGSAVTQTPVADWSVEPVLRLSRALARRGHGGLSRILEPARNDPGYRFDPDGRSPYRDFMRPMLAAQLGRLDANIRARRAVRQRIRERLAGMPEIGWLAEDRHGLSNAAYFGIHVPDPPGLVAFLAGRGVTATAGDFRDCSRLPQFAAATADLVHSRRADAQLLRLPSHPTLGERQIDRIADAVRDFFAHPAPTPGQLTISQVGRRG
ncbi:DegT/DnrJ/EryC1/StrS family aminotransferase [Saccharothrix sp. ST-888]|uniref:DegT/DnrJ/EryC1/StrS family aminotransferase n=1 Tax=Saccharothrix sp. ST-888 TaxID=1427391 RepID=UPI000698F845|nr:aminotransferase class V-fold PLP-dependent enzyme [Saccharothrix sp. ST-888]